MRTRAQKAAQADEQKREGTKGRFGKLNPCYGCGKSAGVNYFSHPSTDTISPKGIGWGDLGLCLCPKCAEATNDMVEPVEFATYAAAKGGLPKEALGRYLAQAKGEVQ
jgi:hypothetical protein